VSTAALTLLGRRLRSARRRATAAALAPYVQPVDADLWCGTRPGRRYWADCYRRACDYVLAHASGRGPYGPIAGMRLVHGVCRDGDLVWAHAWVELPGGRVFDGVRQQFYDRDGYQRVLQTTVEATYGPEAMVAQLRAARHYGPWHDGVLGHDAIGRLGAAPNGC
jgi:hypothetical protein